MKGNRRCQCGAKPVHRVERDDIRDKRRRRIRERIVCPFCGNATALERNIREGVYARDDWDAPCGEEEREDREDRSRFSYPRLKLGEPCEP